MSQRSTEDRSVVFSHGVYHENYMSPLILGRALVCHPFRVQLSNFGPGSSGTATEVLCYRAFGDRVGLRSKPALVIVVVVVNRRAVCRRSFGEISKSLGDGSCSLGVEGHRDEGETPGRRKRGGWTSGARDFWRGRGKRVYQRCGRRVQRAGIASRTRDVQSL